MNCSLMTDAAAPAARPHRGQELELTVDALAYGGNGVARMDGGYVVFVRDGFPGDKVRAVLTKRKRHYGEARVLELLEKSSERIDPVADHPGASWQVLPYERQLEIKREQVDDALRRIGHLEGYALSDIVPAVEQWRYRNKLEFSFGSDPDGKLVCGFHAPGSWEEIVGVDDCMLQSERGNAMRHAVLEWARENELGAYDRREQRGLLRNLVIREGRRTGEIQVRLVITDGENESGLESLADAVKADSLLVTRVADLGETTAGGDTELLAGGATIAEELSGLRFRIGGEAFFQTNTEMAEKLYAIAADAAALEGWERVYDLFCGIGTIGLVLSARAGEVWGVEIVEEAIADALGNARANDVSNAQFFAGDVRTEMRALVERAGRPDVLVVDPPRAGLSQKVVRRVIEAGAKRIV